MLQLIRFLFFPVSIIYGLIIFIRNKCYDWGIFKSYTPKIPVICVGNLSVGGAGKTPTTEYLVRLLSNYKIAILSRGYGRKTNGFVIAKKGLSAEDIGDEPKQYFDKFKDVTVAVCEDRVYGVKKLESFHDIILLDDAFQHRRIKAGLYILLFEFEKLFKFQWLLPTGNLREPLSSRQRADLILITKSPAIISNNDENKIHNKLEMNNGQKIAFSSIEYCNPTIINDIDSNFILHEDVVVYGLTGIANSKPFYDYIKQFTDKIIVNDFPDHYDFKLEDITKIISKFEKDHRKNKIILTTEKDTKRLMKEDIRNVISKVPIAYLPIKTRIAEKDKKVFDEIVLNYVKRIE